jgi:hypothetical protein
MFFTVCIVSILILILSSVFDKFSNMCKRPRRGLEGARRGSKGLGRGLEGARRGSKGLGRGLEGAWKGLGRGLEGAWKGIKYHVD